MGANTIQYNIYAGLKGIFGGQKYLYTTSCTSLGEALIEAHIAACVQYEAMEGTNLIPALEECDDLEESFNSYYNTRESWIEYDAIPTSTDTISEEDIIRDDNFS